MNSQLINDFATAIVAAIHNDPTAGIFANMASGYEWDEAVWVAKELIPLAPRQHVFHPETEKPFCGEENPIYVAAVDGDEMRSVPTCTRCHGKSMGYLQDKLKAAETKVARVSELATEWETEAGPASEAQRVYVESGSQKVSVEFAVGKLRNAIGEVAS